MSERISKDGTKITMVEYEVREINADGDAIDVHHFVTKPAALAAAPSFIAGDTVAVGVEKHTSKRPAFCFSEPDVYKTIATFGNEAALREGGWLE